MSNFRSKIGALLIKPALKGVLKLLDYEQYGGAALLGVNGPVVKAHGSSSAKAYAFAIGQCYKMVKGNVVSIITQQLQAEADA